MKIPPTPGVGPLVNPPTAPPDAAAPVAISGAAQAPATPAAPAGLGANTAAVREAQAALASMDPIDHARVAEIRAAMERGEIRFDADKLASLMQRHHGRRG
jgi:negative regulator of flagellin synthesis FlgM